MSSRRVPLSSNTNAINSPYRGGLGAASKQKRSYATIQREDAYGQPPPAKKQMLDAHQVLRTPPRQQNTQSSAEGRVFTRKSNASQQSSFERKLVAVRDKPAQHVVTRADKTAEENLDQIRQWQKHYRKTFPTFVFYFESIPEDVRLKYTKQVIALGAREEKFFSNAVTHVVTTRAIPATTSPADAAVASSTTNESTSQNSQPQTINPSLLDRSSETANVHSESFGSKGKFTFEPPMSRRLGPQGHEAEIKKQHGRNADVLHRARELGMKIWALEKLQRMMTTMFETDTGYQIAHGHNTRSNSVSTTTSRNTDLSQLLRNERINGPSDRDPTVVTKEMTLFKGPFIYIHDIDEKQRPIMVREYGKVSNKEDGDWPQFRSVANGKCPFVEEVDYSRREAERERELMRFQRQQEKEKSMVPRTRAAAAEASKMQPPRAINGKRALSEVDDSGNKKVTVSTRQANPFAPSKSSISHRTDLEASSRGNQNAFVSRAGAGRLFGGEPVASGVQPSNITSAIRSQMISSTAAQPGAKAGTSKEVHGLQRKVLEKNSGGPGSHGLTSSHRMTDLNTAIKEEPRPSRRKEKLELIEEDTNPSEAEENARKIEAARKAKAVQLRKIEKRDPKPGYCENCQDKFEDFDEHVLSRKHRKFAEKLENWKELDDLLGQLVRPLRQENY
ncbi:Hsk1-interacting molecule [Lachnellula suecica]|uniref:Hsk1-interacting molecule n=1 Tax=Lachnellula suecica TaxID=602035 RepID=A0A8T9BX58_9HELO|nr:Hsk1-interacting molecule [Lachnellula suecica]